MVFVDCQLDGLLEQIGEPSQSCCMGTCQFANAKCGCNDEMVGIINSFVGGNFKFYRSGMELPPTEYSIVVA